MCSDRYYEAVEREWESGVTCPQNLRADQEEAGETSICPYCGCVGYLESPKTSPRPCKKGKICHATISSCPQAGGIYAQKPNAGGTKKHKNRS